MADITQIVVTLIAGIASIIVALVSTGKIKYPKLPRWKSIFKRLWIILLALIGVLGLVYVLSVAINIIPSPLPTFTPITSLNVVWVSQNQIKVSWKNLQSKDNLYLMTSDGYRYYDPKPIPIDQVSSGEQIITVSSGITGIVIGALPKDVTLANFPTNGVELGDQNVPIEIHIQKSIPENNRR